MSSISATQRAALRQAIAEREVAKEALRIASEAAGRGRELLQSAEAKLRGFGDVDGAILKHRAASFKSAAQGGSKPSLALPEDLLKREWGRDEAASAAAAAKAAHESLSADAARAVNALRHAEQTVSEKATAILIAQAAETGSNLIMAWNDLWGTVDLLCAFRGLPLPGPKLPGDVIRALQFLAGYDYRQFPGGRNSALSRAGEQWKAWHEKLCAGDVDAELALIDDGEPTAAAAVERVA